MADGKKTTYLESRICTSFFTVLPIKNPKLDHNRFSESVDDRVPSHADTQTHALSIIIVYLIKWIVVGALTLTILVMP